MIDISDFKMKMVKSMSQTKELGLVLVEFDSIKGPIIRIAKPHERVIPEKKELEKILMWIIRAKEFSVRKIGKSTAYAKILELNDPNFRRNKRQFGFALITDKKLSLENAEVFVDSILNRCRIGSDNQSYFKMLNNLFLTLETMNDKEMEDILKAEEKWEEDINKISIETSITQYVNNKKKGHKSNLLKIVKTIFILEKKSDEEISIFSNNLSEKNAEHIIEEDGYNINLTSSLVIEPTQKITDGFKILVKIFDSLSSIKLFEDRIVAGIEYFDRLLRENVDLEYFLPFLQYMITMEYIQ